MKRIYCKSELLFSLLWIGLYVTLFSIADNISVAFGVEKIVTAPVSILLVLVLFVWIWKNGLAEKYGICKMKGKAREYLYFIPLVVIGSCNLWKGVQLNYSPAETILAVLSMLCVGFIEEIIFRGFLFKALTKENLRWAIIVSGVTFGLGHIVNIFNGAEILPTLLQVFYATAAGLLFVVLFHKCKSLWPCVIAHSMINATSVIGVKMTTTEEIAMALLLTVVSLGYAAFCFFKESQTE